MRQRVWAIVGAAALSAAVTIAHASPLPLQVGTLLAFSQLVELGEAFLIDGFGEPAPGEPIGEPWEISAGDISWASQDGVGKLGGQSQGDNIAVVDVGASTGIVVQTTIVGLQDGPAGGTPTRAGLALLADGAGQQVLVAYERATGTLSVSTPAGVLASRTVTVGLDTLDPLRVELRSVPDGVSLDVSLNGGDVLSVTGPESFATNTRHGIYVSRDNNAVFTQFTIGIMS